MYLSRLSRALVCAALLSAASAVGYAQEQATARVEVTLTGGKGRAAPRLTKEDVRVYVDGVERPVVTLEKEPQPVSYGLVVDNSGSLRSQIGAVVTAAKYLVERNRPGDEAFVVRFVSSDNIKIIQTMTADQSALNGALDRMFVERGQTAMLDALHLAGDYITKNASRAADGKSRRALLLVSDGEDRVSFYKVEQVLKLLKEAGVQVFCVGLTGALDKEQGFITASKRQRAKDLLMKIATETGGQVFYAEKSGELEEAVLAIAENMRARYVVGYEPPAAAKGNGKVEVKVVGEPGKQKLKAQIFPEKK
ncbi:MAG TPA: VWA domain-containing protein [Pyrinomonadaceae bacterium]|nr:VWA domain-containing protein [Pyrinomonadaceae bacterium]